MSDIKCKKDLKGMKKSRLTVLLKTFKTIGFSEILTWFVALHPGWPGPQQF